MCEPLRVAVVGAGHLGRHHARIYAALPQAQLVAVADVDAGRGRAVADATGARYTADCHDLIGHVDAVSIAVPTEGHLAVASPFIMHGIPVLIEKPLARSVAEADQLLALADAHGALIQVGHVERFNPAFIAAKKHVSNPLYIHCERIGPFTFRSLDIGVVLDLMIHDLDILLDLVQAPVADVQAAGVPVLTAHEDIANARITFADGTVASLTASRVATQALRRASIFQPDSYIALDYGQRTAHIHRKRPGAPDPAGIDPRTLDDAKAFVFDQLISVDDVPTEPHDALEQELQAFLHCVATGSAPVCSGRDARQALALAERILESIHHHLQRHAHAPKPS